MNTEFHIIPYAQDNYAYIVSDKQTKEAILIDCGEAKPILQYIADYNLQLKAIFLTHLHSDHAAGLRAVQQVYAGVPSYSGSEQTTYKVDDEQTLRFNSIELKVYDLASHSRYDRGFVVDNAFFSGDVLFSAGCGRLFDGDANDLFQALAKIQTLPKNSNIYFAHEYTQANLAFAKAMDPENPSIKEQERKVKTLRSQGKYSTPTTLATELKINPFLRINEESIIQSIDPKRQLDIIQRLKQLRDKKNIF